MPRPVTLLADATIEARAAFLWYGNRSEIAAERFRDELDHAMDAIAGSPDAWPTYVHATRRYLFRRFPFMVVYRVTPEEIQVVAVAHVPVVVRVGAPVEVHPLRLGDPQGPSPADGGEHDGGRLVDERVRVHEPGVREADVGVPRTGGRDGVRVVKLLSPRAGAADCGRVDQTSRTLRASTANTMRRITTRTKRFFDMARP